MGITLCFFLSMPVFAQDDSTAVSDIELGRRIYVEGILPTGGPLTGSRFNNTAVSGTSAACVNCHRRSGMGQVEGDILVPPISANFLYSTSKVKQYAVMDPRVSKVFNQSHEPYTDVTFADAVTNGKNNSGREMTAAMPRYNLSDSELKALASYLKQLSLQWSPGVTNDRIRLATVITPDVDPIKRKVIIEMMQNIVRQKNGSTETGNSTHTRHHMVSAAEMMLGTERKWDLDIWELQGGSETWGEQLAARYSSQPVFALISGVSNSTWQPVQDFCEKEKVPCWFPSTDVATKSPSQYSIYFSGGLLLEANVLARHLQNNKVKPKNVIQIYRGDSAGQAASQELTHALGAASINVENRTLEENIPAIDALRKAQAKIKSGDVVMYWLRQSDIEMLAKLKPTSGSINYFSERLASSDNLPLPEAWRKTSRLVYLYELPDKREDNLNYLHAWLNLRKLPLIDEAVQSEVFFSFNYFTDTISEMLDNLYRDYLVERGETMINKREGTKAEQETRDRLYLGKPGDVVRKHGEMTADENVRIHITEQSGGHVASHGTTIYPHLSLGPEQRFASKGGYVLRFTGAHYDKFFDESGWIVP